ncbi:SEC-C domain-containing protein, partial [Patescibacteria group bacterium]|nr:SEC-C domain-containing protein [Patescibacteria group bacterium]
MKIGRNDRCPCGSGLKYKKCHLDKPLKIYPEPFKDRSIRERNIILLNAITDIFFGKGEGWDEMRSSLTEDKVRELYKIITWLWPPQTDITSLLPQPSKVLRGLYTGDERPQDILQNIVRYSLYTEEILVVSPFLAPLTMREEFSPLYNPRQYRQDTLELIYFALSIAPWIEAGIVNMIPNPMDFDFHLRKEIYSMATARYEANKEEFDKEIKSIADDEGKQEYKRMMMRMPVDSLRRRLKEFKPNLSQTEIDKHVEYFLKQRKDDPLLLDEEMSSAAEMKIKRMGANLELGLYLGQATGSYLYTNRAFQWKEIMSAQQQTTDDSEIWSPLTQAFQSLDFTFLNNVDAGFAYKLKEEGRLGGFRNYLRKVWNKIGENNTPSQANSAAREFSDELHEQYGKTKEEWAKIDKSIIEFMLGSAGISTVLSPLITGGLDWTIPALGFSVAGVGKLLSARYQRKEFTASIPLAV